MYTKIIKTVLSLGGLVLLLGLPIVYIANASHALQSGGLVPVEHVAFLPASAFPAGSISMIWHTGLFAFGLFLTCLLPKKVRSYLILIMLAGTLGIVLMALHHRLDSGSVYDWTWLFVSRNQFAAFACLSFPLALTLGARCKYEAFLSGRLSNPSGICYLVAGLFAAAVVQTGSRAGILILVLQTVGFVLITLWIRHCYPIAISPPSALQRLFIVGALLLGIGFGGVALSRSYTAIRRADHDFNFRSVVRSDTLDMWRAHKWWGTGPGTFERVFSYYQTLPVEQYYFRHAHCEPLQFLAEYGILGCGLILLAIGLILGNCGQSNDEDQLIPPQKTLEGSGLGLALGGVLLHGLVDFPFRHPLILFVTAVWIAMLADIYTERTTAN